MDVPILRGVREDEVGRGGGSLQQKAEKHGKKS
jgi:hypothetical protein